MIHYVVKRTGQRRLYLSSLRQHKQGQVYTESLGGAEVFESYEAAASVVFAQLEVPVPLISEILEYPDFLTP